MAEWLRRWTANPLGSARVGSNPILVEYILLCAKIIMAYEIQDRRTPVDFGGTVTVSLGQGHMSMLQEQFESQ